MSKFKKFKAALKPGIEVRRTGLLGYGRQVEVKGGGLTYRVDRRTANEHTAATLNSKIPIATLRPQI